MSLFYSSDFHLLILCLRTCSTRRHFPRRLRTPNLSTRDTTLGWSNSTIERKWKQVRNDLESVEPTPLTKTRRVTLSLACAKHSFKVKLYRNDKRTTSHGTIICIHNRTLRHTRSLRYLSIKAVSLNMTN